MASYLNNNIAATSPSISLVVLLKVLGACVMLLWCLGSHIKCPRGYTVHTPWRDKDEVDGRGEEYKKIVSFSKKQRAD